MFIVNPEINEWKEIKKTGSEIWKPSRILIISEKLNN